MDAKLLGILQHSLGVDRYGNGEQYRNRFVAGDDDVDACRELVAMGLMMERRPSTLTGGDPWFVVTNAGKDAVALNSPKPPKITQGRRNYLAYLAADIEEPFIEFLKHDEFKDYRKNFIPKYY